MNELTKALIETGLVQFGRFHQGGEYRPFRFLWEILPAYPDVLKRITAEIATLLESMNVDRLLVPNDALSLGVAVSLTSNIPLVYRLPQDVGLPSLVGAYDNGHTTLILTFDVLDIATIATLISSAEGVGLKVVAGISMIDFGGTRTLAIAASKLPWQFALCLDDIVTMLRANGELSAGQAKAVQTWIDAKPILHPD